MQDRQLIVEEFKKSIDQLNNVLERNLSFNTENIDEHAAALYAAVADAKDIHAIAVHEDVDINHLKKSYHEALVKAESKKQDLIKDQPEDMSAAIYAMDAIWDMGYGLPSNDEVDSTPDSKSDDIMFFKSNVKPSSQENVTEQDSSLNKTLR